MRTKKSAAAAKPQTSELVEAIKMLASEKSISEEMLFSTVEDALKKAYQKNLPNGVLVPSPNNITATIDRMTGEVHVYTRRLIVEEIETPTADQITLEEARKIKDTYQMGDIVETDVTPRGFLRVAAQTAKGGANGGIVQSVAQPVVIVGRVRVVGQVFQQRFCQIVGKFFRRFLSSYARRVIINVNPAVLTVRLCGRSV
jgi:hypothetical protein